MCQSLTARYGLLCSRGQTGPRLQVECLSIFPAGPGRAELSLPTGATTQWSDATSNASSTGRLTHRLLPPPQGTCVSGDGARKVGQTTARSEEHTSELQ